MGLAFTIIYLALQFLSVDQFEALRGTSIMVVLAVLAGLGSVLPLISSSRFIINKQFLLMTAFTGFLIVSPVLHGWVGGMLPAFLKFFPAAILFFLIAINMRSTAYLKVLRLIVFGMLVYLMSSGFYEYRNNQGVTSPFVLVVAADSAEPILRIRALGIIQDPNEFSQLLLAWLPLLFLAGRKKTGLQASLVLKFLIAVMMLTAIYLSHSRGALVGLAVLCIFSAGKKYRTFAIFAGAAGVIVLGVFAKFGGGDRSVSIGGGRDRLEIWSDGIGLLKRSPIWGIGYGAFPDEVGMTAHNSFLLCVTELGFIGYLLWIALLMVSIRQLWIILAVPAVDEKSMELQRWARALCLSLYVYLVTGFFLSQTYHAGLYMLLGMTAAVASMHAERNRVQELVPRGDWGLRWSFATCLGSILVIYLLVRIRAV
jgi:putative inorganic carbon (HCO3(-)) transporter